MIDDSPIPHLEATGPCEWRKLRITPELMNQMAEAAAGRGVVIHWGEPDYDGFYSPWIETKEDE